ncbi:MAG: hypothetical protein CMQ05_13340 [Gammaproteobacteria bacterium]|nr:hypothetical protein [Gammaproteobacteria bacterium]RPG26985.1 MAG: alpha/beta hydrolase [Gammaproteobacteria bacterium TMED50]|tara:strand:- start:5802 stop:6632 length:831 start_codon:yes stop_codon:yes gene_type:complete
MVEQATAEPILLYEDQPEGVGPGSEMWARSESLAEIWWSNKPVARNVSCPALTSYVPDPAVACGAGVILCPGGGFHFLALEQEGHDVARALCDAGIAAFVLKYRLVQTDDDYAEAQRDMGNTERRQKMTELMPMIREDGLRALSKVKSMAADLGLDPDRMGMMGYSAGGNVVVNTALHAPEGEGPAFTAAIYTAGWDDVPVPNDAGPLFVLCTADDAMASPNSIRLYELWRAAGKVAELHIYGTGGHGFCLRPTNQSVDTWLDRFRDFLAVQGLLD